MEKETVNSTIDTTKHICINCNTEFTDTFCPHCGQRVGEQKITLRMLFVMGLKDLFKMNSGFLYTFTKLAIRPWAVIRDYVNGHRVQYTSPINMLVISLFYVAIFAAIFHGSTDIFTIDFSSVYDSLDHHSKFEHYIDVIKNSSIFWLLVLSVPTAFATYLTYYKPTNKRWSFAEYLLASLYAICGKIIWIIILMPIKDLHYPTGMFLDSVVTAFLFIGLLYNAFRFKNIWKRIGFMVLNLLNIVLFTLFTLFAIIVIFILILLI